MRRKPTLLLTLLLTAILTSCSTIDCPVQNTVNTYYALKDSVQGDYTLNGDTIDVYTRQRSGKDTLILNQLVNGSTFSLPIGYSNPEDTLYFKLRRDTVETVDTVWIKKENMPHFESVDCSAAYFHEITDIRYTAHGLDSIVINNHTVDYDAKAQHFYLYLKARH